MHLYIVAISGDHEAEARARGYHAWYYPTEGVTDIEIRC
jgi:hypothetical protein